MITNCDLTGNLRHSSLNIINVFGYYTCPIQLHSSNSMKLFTIEYLHFLTFANRWSTETILITSIGPRVRTPHPLGIRDRDTKDEKSREKKT